MVTTTPVQPSRRAPRLDTPARWQAALTRAHEESIEVRQLAGCGAWIATSGTDATTAYVLTPWECECHAGAFGDPICKHRAALRQRLGWIMEDTEPEPTPPVVVAVVVRVAEVPCGNCQGHGWGYGTVPGGRIERVTCWTCDGTGVEPATLAV